MWKLKISEGNDGCVKSVNNHTGRQFWEFKPELGTPEEKAQVEILRKHFTKNRFQQKHSSDLIMRLQVNSLYLDYSYIFFEGHFEVFYFYSLQRRVHVR